MSYLTGKKYLWKELQIFNVNGLFVFIVWHTQGFRLEEYDTILSWGSNLSFLNISFLI